jgi:hypothetical protein
VEMDGLAQYVKQTRGSDLKEKTESSGVGAVEGGRRPGDASDGGVQESVGCGASRHADQHSQSGVDVPESRTMEGGRRTNTV